MANVPPVTSQPGAPPPQGAPPPGASGYGVVNPAYATHPVGPVQPIQPGYAMGQQPGYAPQPAYGQPAYGAAPYGAPPGMPPGMPQDVWMPALGPIPDCPKGLEYLTKLDQILIKQKTSMLEVFTGWESSNKYKVLNNQGQQCYYALEKSHVCCRQCCGPNRKFKINITDNNKETVIIVRRPFKWCAGGDWCACIRCFQDEVTVTAGNGEILGYVRQACSAWKPHYMILDHNKEEKMEIWGPCCPCTMCGGTIEFPIYSPGTEEVIAKINKQWSGLTRELFTDSDNFGVSFPMDLDVRIKATLMGAVFLIDFMYFEEAGQEHNNY